MNNTDFVVDDSTSSNNVVHEAYKTHFSFSYGAVKYKFLKCWLVLIATYYVIVVNQMVYIKKQ